MLAPRKKLWTTPKEGLLKGVDLLRIGPNDIVYDIGCGDGNFLFHCLDYLHEEFVRSRNLLEHEITLQIKGIDIEEERIHKIKEKIKELREQHTYGEGGDFLFDRLTVIQQNALDLTYSDGTCFYLYLIPRGLKQVIDILVKNIHHPFRVVTFIYPIPNYSYQATEKVHSEKHEGSQWPLFYYEFPLTTNDLTKEDTVEQSQMDEISAERGL